MKTIQQLALLPIFACSVSSMAFADTYSIGIVPQFEVKKLHAIWKPILDELSVRTGHQFVFRGAPTISAFEKEFLAGQFDFAYMNPYHYFVAQDIYTPLVRDVGKQLSGIVVVAKDSPYQSLADLNKKLIALPAPNALGASLMTRAAMTNEYKIDYFTKYVNTHSSVYLNVALGKADAGGGVLKTLSQQPERIQQRLRVLYTTPKVAPHPVVVNKQVPASVAKQVQEAFLAIGSTSAGAELLAKVPFKTIGVATTIDYEPFKALKLDAFYVHP
ncbi:phosphonate transport system substrate-binding protein [Oceanospirillum multiglobuliferum]|uniref:Phosphate ABC transporter n=1 Tax=Oceanospirillum multiglobuliferum TaxID=64969 RepID=A0A1T4PUC6_9GAMM|nr:phosphate/phosphite/phosphonate ABC transporter substrate-binding protein [Oceanospirillum multiglobuliferum]OPX55310.1 hypothetical protein BTE48_09065 [Oceanospirillum multiglobuliferum]SJZ95175.1 phosphonate transport system substrate-binding protein [Oceanospirillum multiglobuliferum]